MRPLLFISLLIISISCSSPSKNKDPLGVSLNEFDSDKNKPKIKEPESYGPESQEGEGDLAQRDKEPVLALMLGPGLNRTLGHAYFIKSLNRNNINIRIISGSGMGAVVAAHYAAGKSPEKIEWLFYKFLNEVKGKRALSPRWRKELKNTLLKEFKNKTIQGLEISLVIPVFEKEKFQVINWPRGPLYNALIAQFDFYDPKMAGNFSTPLQWAVYNSNYLKDLGADIVIGVDVLADKIELKIEDGFLYGYFGNMIGRVEKERKDLNLYYSLPFSDVPLDSEKNLPKNIQLMRTKGEEMAKAIKDYIVDWKQGQAKLR